MNMIKQVTLGRTGITVPQNAFGALPVQRDDRETAVKLLRRAWEGGMTFFDTARAYSDSEEKLGAAFGDTVFRNSRERIFIATKTGATKPDEMKRHLETSLTNLKTDYVDIYQLHCAAQCYRPGDGTGVYEQMEDFKRQGLIRHIGITAHKIGVAEEAVPSGLYETLQFPFSYLSGQRERALVALCARENVGFIAMKGLAGGLITRYDAAFAFMAQFGGVLPIWGIQRERELDEWLSCFDNPPVMTEELAELIRADRAELGADFCRGCGYCMPCPQGIVINQCARMSLMLRRAPSKAWLSEYWQEEMKRAETCLHCGACVKKCPYELDTPALLEKNVEDYKKVLAGERTV